MAERNDEQLLAGLCSEQNREAEDELYTKYAARLYALCLRYCGNPEDAKDLMQDAFIKALESISSFSYRGEGSLYAWISRIAINMALNKLKRQKLKFVSFDVFRSDVADDPPAEDVARIPARILLKMVSELPALKRTVFNMFCIDGYSHKEIAEQLGITEKGSSSIFSKAKTQLKAQVNEYIKKSEEQ